MTQPETRTMTDVTKQAAALANQICGCATTAQHAADVQAILAYRQAALTTAQAEAAALKKLLTEKDAMIHQLGANAAAAAKEYADNMAALRAEVEALREAGDVLNRRLAGFVYALAEMTDCGPDVDAMNEWKRVTDCPSPPFSAKMASLAQALVNHNEVLRSAYQIAARKGEHTEWEGFTLRAGSVLHFHHEEVEAARTALDPQP